MDFIVKHSSGIYVDTRPRQFHGYTVMWCGTVIGKKGNILKKEKRARRGGGFDLCVRLYINKKCQKFTLQRLIADVFLGCIIGYEINHKKRDTTLNGGHDIEILSRSQNQNHWRNDEREKAQVRELTRIPSGAPLKQSVRIV